MINEEKLKELREIYNYVKEAKKNMSSEKKKKMWSSWYNMMSRCYGLQSRKKGHENCLVCKEWHIPFVYYKWWIDNYYEIGNEQMDLDKDILKKGNYIYSPKYAMYVPHRINTLFEQITCKINYKNGKYVLNFGGKEKRIEKFDTELEAKQRWIEYKTKLIRDCAAQYKGKIPDRLYNAMIEWKIELSDWDNK